MTNTGAHVSLDHTLAPFPIVASCARLPLHSHDASCRRRLFCLRVHSTTQICAYLTTPSPYHPALVLGFGSEFTSSITVWGSSDGCRVSMTDASFSQDDFRLCTCACGQTDSTEPLSSRALSRTLHLWQTKLRATSIDLHGISDPSQPPISPPSNLAD